MSQTIVCPNCSTQIDLDKLADQKYSEKLREQETKLRDEQEKQRLKFEKEMEDKTNEMRKKAQEYAEKKAEEERKKVELEMKDMKERLEKSEKDQEEAKKKELEYQKQQEQLKKSLDDAKRKAEQGSQQIQGDIQEDDLKNAISQAFPIDNVDDVPTGIKGADLIQTVKNNLGQDAGVIIWESKNTKSWTDGWIPKLKDDKLKINAQIAILVTTVLPKDMKEFGFVDDVMVCLPKYAVGVATMLRDKLISISKVEKSMEGKDIKMEMLYKYLRSEEFGSKVVTIVEVFSKLKADIDIERRAMEKIWKRREKELERASLSTTMMYGELEGLMGQALPGAEMLELGAGDLDLDDL